MMYVCDLFASQIWNVSTGKEVAHRPTGSDYWMIDVAFSPCSRRLSLSVIASRLGGGGGGGKDLCVINPN